MKPPSHTALAHGLAIRAVLCACLAVLSAVSVTAGGEGQTTGDPAVAVTVVSVYDGDTFRCDIDGFPEIIGRNISVRVKGIDTPELRDKRPEVKKLAQEARAYTQRRLAGGRVIELRGMERGKYFRILAEVYVDGVSLGDELLAAGLARPYDGGKKPGW